MLNYSCQTGMLFFSVGWLFLKSLLWKKSVNKVTGQTTTTTPMPKIEIAKLKELPSGNADYVAVPALGQSNFLLFISLLILIPEFLLLLASYKFLDSLCKVLRNSMRS
jgi:hypothetical protein